MISLDIGFFFFFSPPLRLEYFWFSTRDHRPHVHDNSFRILLPPRRDGVRRRRGCLVALRFEAADSCGVNSGSPDTRPAAPLDADQTSITPRQHATYTLAGTTPPPPPPPCCTKLIFASDKRAKQVRDNTTVISKTVLEG